MTAAAPDHLSVGLLQLNVCDDPLTNLRGTIPLIRAAVAAGAELVVTPEATNLLSPDRKRQTAVLHTERRTPRFRRCATRRRARASGC